ncbi:MAG: hypothetical protein WCK34_02895 [Bacteroidota bacterium]
MKKSFILSLLIATACLSVNAQTAEDALRYSRVFYSGTARFNGLSGASGAVGLDISTFATNPAGIGLYKNSEATITLAPAFSNTSSSYNGNNSSDFTGNMGLGNAGVVLNLNPLGKNSSGSVKSINVGIAFNRQNDFNNRIVIHGVNNTNSMMQGYVNTLNGSSEYIAPASLQDNYPFDIGLAYNTNLLGYDPVSKLYYCDAPVGGVIQDKTITTSGSMNELDLSVGGSLEDKLFLGMTLGISSINYVESSIYSETRADTSIHNFYSFNYRYDLHTRGTGVNLKLGLIYIPANWIRLGASIHTPTWYPNMRDEWYSSMRSTFSDSTNWSGAQDSPIGTYDYQMLTPFRAMGSLAFVFGRIGLISADYEYVDYSRARFNSTDDNFTDVNNQIKSSYQSWGTVRIGTEWKISNFRLRGGCAYYSDPYKSEQNKSDRIQVSGGIGYRGKHYFADLAYVWTKMNQDYYLYDLANPAPVTYKTSSLLATIGFRF